ncbi:MAG: hypothetical protein ACRC80_18715 [Waterburya sp.]
MTDSKDNPKKLEQTAESSQADNTEASHKSTEKKKFKFKEEDMYKIKYNF